MLLELRNMNARLAATFKGKAPEPGWRATRGSVDAASMPAWAPEIQAEDELPTDAQPHDREAVLKRLKRSRFFNLLLLAAQDIRYEEFVFDRVGCPIRLHSTSAKRSCNTHVASISFVIIEK
jgi:hypothetical protein